jgi:hypothetical protein
MGTECAPAGSVRRGPRRTIVDDLLTATQRSETMVPPPVTAEQQPTRFDSTSCWRACLARVCSGPTGRPWRRLSGGGRSAPAMRTGTLLWIRRDRLAALTARPSWWEPGPDRAEPGFLAGVHTSMPTGSRCWRCCRPWPALHPRVGLAVAPLVVDGDRLPGLHDPLALPGRGGADLPAAARREQGGHLWVAGPSRRGRGI